MANVDTEWNPIKYLCKSNLQEKLLSIFAQAIQTYIGKEGPQSMAPKTKMYAVIELRSNRPNLTSTIHPARKLRNNHLWT